MKTPQKFFSPLVVSTLFLFVGRASAKAGRQEQSPRSKPGWTATADLGFGKPMNLRGALWMVNGSEKLVVVMAPDHVPFDFRVTRTTRIKVGGRAATFAELEKELHRNVRVNFSPEPYGDMARSIHVARS